MADRITNILMVVLTLSIILAAGAYGGSVAYAQDAGPAVDMPEPIVVPLPTVIVPVPVPSIETDPVGFAAGLYNAVRSGQWALVVGLCLVGVTYAARRWLLKGWTWAQTDRGGVILAGSLALFGAVGNAALAGTWPDGKTLLAALQVALVAMGGYAGLKKLAFPSKAAP